MTEHRILRRPFVPLVIGGLVLFAAFAFSAWAVHVRSTDLDQILKEQQTLIFQNCVSNEIQDSVIVAQLRAALRRAKATLPAGSPILQEQTQAIEDGIAALEPPGESDCVPPEGTQP